MPQRWKAIWHWLRGGQPVATVADCAAGEGLQGALRAHTRCGEHWQARWVRLHAERGLTLDASSR